MYKMKAEREIMKSRLRRINYFLKSFGTAKFTINCLIF